MDKTLLMTIGQTVQVLLLGGAVGLVFGMAAMAFIWERNDISNKKRVEFLHKEIEKQINLKWKYKRELIFERMKGETK